MGVAVLGIVLLYILGSTIVLVVLRKVFKRWWPLFPVGLALMIYPFWDLIMVKSLYWHYARQEPLQEIRRVDDSPQSVLWLDEVWPGFDEYGQHWMVKSYLDGKHLKTLGLTGGTETHVYIRGADGMLIKNKPDEPLPKFKYTIHFARVRLPAWQEKYIWCDEIRIRDNEKNEDIAFSRRYLAYTPKSGFDVVGDSPFRGGERLGDDRVYEFDDKVLFRYAGVREPDFDRDFLRRSSYALAVIRWKRSQKRLTKFNSGGVK